MKKSLLYLLAALSFVGAVSCSKDDDPEPVVPDSGSSYVYILNEGGMGSNNASLSRWDIDNSTMTNNLYSTATGSPLGDTGNDILATDNFLIIAVNGSNIIEFCDHDGKSKGSTEHVPGPRKLAVDDGTYLYVTSYADGGYVAKIQLSTYEVVDTVHVGHDPEGIVYYNGSLYVANTGGNGWSAGYGYEQSISVIDAASMTETARIDTGHYNLYGAFLQNKEHPRYILVNAAGDYGANPASSFIFDCDSKRVVAEYDFPVTYATQYDGVFYALGSNFSYATYKYEYSCNKIDLSSGSPVASSWSIPGLSDMTAPYGIYYTEKGELFVTDAGDYKSRGTLYRYDQSGTLLSTETVGICPGHFAEY